MERQVRGEKRRERRRARWEGAKRVRRMVKMRKMVRIGRNEIFFQEYLKGWKVTEWKGKEGER